MSAAREDVISESRRRQETCCRRHRDVGQQEIGEDPEGHAAGAEQRQGRDHSRPQRLVPLIGGLHRPVECLPGGFAQRGHRDRLGGHHQGEDEVLPTVQ
jgi:hypothetical protein